MNKNIFLVAGFNNWGKSTIIHKLFGKKRYAKHLDHALIGTNIKMTVQEQSNDDVGIEGLTKRLKERINKSPSCGQNIIMALCPTKEEWNQSVDFLMELDKEYTIHLILLEYKWDNHAKLNISEIENMYREIRKNIMVVNDQNLDTKIEKINTYILNTLGNANEEK